MTGTPEVEMVRFLTLLESPYSADVDLQVDPYDLVRYALDGSDYWASKALDWLSNDLAAAPVDDVLLGYSMDGSHPQALRHRAAKLRHAS
ncbi:MAG: hypothetical protein U0Q03_00080 [Acidimicrobiales bacterium]